MADLEKVCARCGTSFQRRGRLSSSQWLSRTFCSKRCSATRSAISNIEVQSLYQSGMSSTELELICGVTATSIRRAIKKSGGEIRSLSEAISLSHNKPGMPDKFSAIHSGRKLPETAKQKLRDLVGPANPHWRGGITMANGYLCYTKSTANADRAGMLVHRVIAQQMVGRDLASDEHVHHIDGNKANNDQSNLMVMKAHEHIKLHAALRFQERKAKHNV